MLSKYFSFSLGCDLFLCGLACPASIFYNALKNNTMQLVIDYQHKPATTSLLVAERFGKDHKNVLRDIENLECSTNFWRLNFELSNYESRGKSYPMYIMTRDGFTFLVMGFTGLSAANFKEEYIEQFNKMETVIRSTTPQLIPIYQERILSEPTLNVPKGYLTGLIKSCFLLKST